jgi:hypothetical protein
MLRLDPRLIDEVKQANDGNFTQAVEAALQAWLKRARRNTPKPAGPAEHLGLPTARGTAARTKDRE